VERAIRLSLTGGLGRSRLALCGGGVVSREEDRKQGVKLFGLGVE
jgi:hypothetical protein